MLCALLARALDALALVARPNSHYFGIGNSAGETPARYWQFRLRTIASAAGVVGFRTHRLRDTFAVEQPLRPLSRFPGTVVHPLGVPAYFMPSG